MPSDPNDLRKVWSRHERRWKENRYVYPVVSRRSGGVSVGVNLNPDKACNFDCIYCQVDRSVPSVIRKVDLRQLADELDAVLRAEREGALYEASPCDALAADQRGVRDIAFSGDGEPTTYPKFPDSVRIAAEARQRFELHSAKIVLITNAAYLHKPAVREGLAIMDENSGEIWAKLDAGTEEHFRLVDRPNASFHQILDNILDAARIRPLVIQSLWMRVRGIGPTAAEIEAYSSRLKEIVAQGGRLKAIQIYTIARPPAEGFVSALSICELDSIAAVVRRSVPVPVETYGPS